MMKEKYNLKTIILGLIILVVGILLIVFDSKLSVTEAHEWLSVGCSLIASSLVMIVVSLTVDKVKENPLEMWGIKKIYQTRSKMNDDCCISLKNAKYQVDIVAFGLKSFRSEQEKLTSDLLKKGVNFRIITMDPNSNFLKQREIEEEEQPGQIENTINQLIIWADKMNRKRLKGAITIKGYSCMTLDFYWRVDDDIYIGPYWYGLDSQQTISYKYTKGSGFEMYSNYFDKLWNDSEIMRKLTK